MNDEGYTLMEMLVALMILGLSVAGLLAGVQLLGRQQLFATGLMTDTQRLRDAQVHLEMLLARAGPVRAMDPGRLTGDAASFSFACAGAEPCRAQLQDGPQGVTLLLDDGAGPARLALSAPGPARFLYRGRLGDSETWPPPNGTPDALRSVSVLTRLHGADAAVVVARLWPEQAPLCAFDLVSQDCA